MHNPLIFSGNANRPLAEEIARHLGGTVGRALVSTFKDGETQVDVGASVREGDVFIIQPTCPPVNDHLMELLLMMDAMRRASAHRMTAVIPYFGYSSPGEKKQGAGTHLSQAGSQPHGHGWSRSFADHGSDRTSHRGFFRYSC